MNCDCSQEILRVTNDSPNPLCICFLTQAFPDSAGAYRGIFIQTLAGALIRQGLCLVVVTPKIFGMSKRVETVDGIIVRRFRFPSGGKPLIAFKKIPVFRMLVYMVTCFLSAFMTILKYHCELIHVHWIHPNGIIGIALGLLFRIPVIIHVRGSDLHTYGLRNRFLKTLTHFTLVHANRVLCTSLKSRHDILEKFRGMSGKKIEVIYNEVDTVLFHPMAEQTARKELRLDLDRIHFIFIGNIREEKGVGVLLSVIKNIFPICQERMICHFVGEGALTARLVQETQRLGVSSVIKFHGPVAHEQIPLWMNAANALILPSVREGMPNVVLEALACGIPVIASDAGDTGIFIRDEINGFLLKDKIEAELEARLTKILLEPELLIKMKKKLQYLVMKKQSVPDEDNAMVTLYDSLLRGRGKPETA